MKKILFLVMVLVGTAAFNARLSSSRECACAQECWCKRALLRHYRWVAPPFLHKIDLTQVGKGTLGIHP